METVIALFVVIAMILVAFVIGKGIMEQTQSDEKEKQPTSKKPPAAYMSVVYVIIGLLAIWLFTKIWFSLGIHTEGTDFQKLK